MRATLERQKQETGAQPLRKVPGLSLNNRERLQRCASSVHHACDLGNHLQHAKGEPVPNVRWEESDIKRSYTLPVSRAWLAQEMEELGVKLVRKGSGRFGRGWVRLVPRVEKVGIVTHLTWFYASQIGARADQPIIRWRLKDTEAGVLVDAFCYDEPFERMQYELEEVAQMVVERRFDGLKSSGATASEATSAQRDKAALKLTRKEAEVAELKAQGLQHKEIAEALFISEHTVKTHVRSISRKLPVADPGAELDTMEIIRLLREHGFGEQSQG